MPKVSYLPRQYTQTTLKNSLLTSKCHVFFVSLIHENSTFLVPFKVESQVDI